MVDRFFGDLTPFTEAITACDEKIRESRIKYNKLVDEFGAAVDKMEKLRKQKSRTGSASIPLMNPQSLPLMESKPLEMLKTAPLDMLRPQDPLSMLMRKGSSDIEKAADDARSLSIRLDQVGQYSDDQLDKVNELYKASRIYIGRMTRQGRIMNDGLTDFGEVSIQPMEPMQIIDPYAFCFALLYLAEINDDLPWLYGACIGLMGEVVEALPWGIYEFDEIDDDIWCGNQMIAEEAKLPKSITIPEMYDRHYRMKGDGLDFPRSLVQIVYEETGCILPRNLHIYDERARMLGKYGIKGKDAATTLMLMSTIATARHSINALNMNADIDLILGDEREEDVQAEPTETVSNAAEESVDDLKAEIKRLKAALHASDKENRETKKTLASITATAEREHRELADLREYVFNEEREAEEPEATDTVAWPYDVQRDTVVFGGHPSWVRGIKGLLTGNIRFIDKDLISFDTGIVRHADVLWIQPNAMSHTMFYRIIDTARTYGKPVRYFTFASWAKSAEQVAEGDSNTQ